MPVNFREIVLEKRNEDYLLEMGGYVKLDETAGYDASRAIFPEELINYIKNSQKQNWDRYQARRNDPEGKELLKRFEDEVKIKGLIKVLRNGIDAYGINFRVVTFKPKTGMNQNLYNAYTKNRLGIVRQLHYSIANRNSLDTVLFINGIPIVTIEFKNEYTGQNYENAIRQYKEDRDPKENIFKLNKGAIVHFAVDTKNAYMTTKLEGDKTIFIPFNQGSNGPGVDGGAGNPTNENDYDVSYLWEKIFQKEHLLQIISQYVQVEEKSKKPSKIIFPRYHQLDVVEKLIENANSKGSGNNYLIQHSAGSGKSNSISWLAHRLINITKDEKRVFSSVIVVTDRKVLDSQLQDTIYGFDHTIGTVEKIDKDKTSQDLLKAINSKKDIIITTIQKFPRIFKEIDFEKDDRNFAIIVDEAHQSQTGSSARALTVGLADIEKKLEEFKKIEGKTEEEMKSEEDLINEIVSQGKHKNLSFFAFTATPKNKTLETFGHKNTEGKYVPFHVYSMRQAIEEGFILDVLNNYTTYKTYFNINKKLGEDPEIKRKRGIKQVLKYESLHPYNISQKTAIILEHFNSVTKYKIDSKAKAMLVTPSRLHAVRYILEIKKQIEDKHYEDIKPLVAFSGDIENDGITYRESSINTNKNGNSIQENQLPEYFKNEFNFLVVAEKYQTGFDEPLLHSMYIDKMLNGVKAVQTISRLNRVAPGKKDTFVMDFANTTDQIRDSFQPYFQTTYLENETDPNSVYDLKNSITDFKLFDEKLINEFNDIYYSKKEVNAGKFSNFFNPALERFNQLEIEKQKEFKSSIDLFLRLYTFITNIENFYDTKIHKFFNYVKFLRKVLPRENEENVSIDDKLLLEKIKYEKSFEESISLDKDSRGLSGITGTITVNVEEKDSLSKIIDEINQRFGTNFKEDDKVVVEQIAENMSKDGEVIDFVNENNLDTFKLVNKEKIEDIILQRQEQNNLLFKKIFEDNDFKNEIIEGILNEIYKRVRGKKKIKNKLF